jgi:predicted acylesterase/phospholipase RssA
MKINKLSLIKGLLIAVIIITPLLIIYLNKWHDKDAVDNVDNISERSGTAIIITGAAARIPQEAALLEELDKRGLLKDVVFISGASSGALNSLALNGILSGKITWTEYKAILFSIRDSNIFVRKGKKLPVSTEPEREFITNFAENKLGYHTMGDLPFSTGISITELRDLDLKQKAYRMCSRKINKETDTTLSIVDILMASSAFPVAFPEVRIRNVTTIPDVKYADGGIGDDHVPFQALLDFEKHRGTGVARIYVVSRKSIPEVSEELRILGINDKSIFDDLGVSLDNIMKKGIIKRLKAFAKEAPDHVPLTYIWMPDFNGSFLMFNFDDFEEQYSITAKWAKNHNPVPLEEFLKPYYHELKNEFE